jgi:hypothetical protein
MQKHTNSLFMLVGAYTSSSTTVNARSFIKACTQDLNVLRCVVCSMLHIVQLRGGICELRSIKQYVYKMIINGAAIPV